MTYLPLPRKNKRKEAKLDGLVLEWFAKNWPNSCAIEVKIKGGKVQPHQEAALKQVAKGKFSYKIPDMGRRTCYDGYTLINADAFLVTCDGRVCDAFNYKTNETFTIKI